MVKLLSQINLTEMRPENFQSTKTSISEMKFYYLPAQ